MSERNTSHQIKSTPAEEETTAITTIIMINFKSIIHTQAMHAARGCGDL